jgi:hypothetical protein
VHDSPVEALHGLADTALPNLKALSELSARHGGDPFGVIGELAWNAIKGMGGEWQKAGQKVVAAAKAPIGSLDQSGDIVEALGHAGAGSIPVVGPAAAHAGEQMAAGNVWRGAGEGAGLLLPTALSEGASALARPVYRSSIKLSPTDAAKYGDLTEAGLASDTLMTAAGSRQAKAAKAQMMGAKEQALRSSPVTDVPTAPIQTTVATRIAPDVNAEINAGLRTSSDVPVVDRFGGGRVSLSPIELEQAKSALDDASSAAQRASRMGTPVTADATAAKMLAGESGDTLATTLPAGQYRGFNQGIMDQTGLQKAARKGAQANSILPSASDVVAGAATYYGSHNPVTAAAVAGLAKLLRTPGFMSSAGLVLNKIDPMLVRAAVLANLTHDQKGGS